MSKAKINKSVDLSSSSGTDDSIVKMIRSGDSKSDKNFLRNNPYFTPEAMEKRSQLRSIDSVKRWKKELIKKYGK